LSSHFRSQAAAGEAGTSPVRTQAVAFIVKSIRFSKAFAEEL